MLWHRTPGPSIVRAGAVGWFLAAMIVYVEARSLLSRGYSLRVLVDLLDAPRHATVRELAMGYGGMGLRGMLAKRVASLAALGLVRSDGARVGPLTPAGRAMARLGLGFRRALRLDTVG
jgi:hypothetical protein